MLVRRVQQQQPLPMEQPRVNRAKEDESIESFLNDLGLPQFIERLKELGVHTTKDLSKLKPEELQRLLKSANISVRGLTRIFDALAKLAMQEAKVRPLPVSGRVFAWLYASDMCYDDSVTSMSQQRPQSCIGINSEMLFTSYSYRARIAKQL